MKKRIEIEFDVEDKNGFSEPQMEELNKLMMKYILKMLEWSSPKKVTIDGNVFWLRSDEKPKAAPKKKYPVHHEDHVVISRPRIR